VPSRTIERMPITESTIRAPRSTLPSQSTEFSIWQFHTLVPGRKRAWVKIGYSWW
jgi:hypothetical protein